MKSDRFLEILRSYTENIYEYVSKNQKLLKKTVSYLWNGGNAQIYLGIFNTVSAVYLVGK